MCVSVCDNVFARKREEKMQCEREWIGRKVTKIKFLIEEDTKRERERQIERKRHLKKRFKFI